jgi:hypothetical protein
VGDLASIDAIMHTLVEVEQAPAELEITRRRVQQLRKQGRLGRMMLHRCIITRQELDEFKKLERPSGIRKEFHVKQE